ncbi:triose-phosphate isomerase [Cardinium endosymbiont of Culicoides punctatus]|uniref:triose-phosphate isomerase n=1 Tax=Cardinium endosymbiont of Culicoides punctatus TaxID=2304601 RepID=UPI001058D283|nr:triose-phosphate isomerase [Cardinium endosymbiont of Culicoides punctatus]TDG95287.1 Triosephosphate isomerase [Cardinium endosymbiont of Culicoides punctatus]
MMHKYLIGNWKMNKTLQEAMDCIQYLLPQLEAIKDAIHSINLNLVIAPSFVHLWPIKELIQHHTLIQLAAQNCHHEIQGAFTGEVSAAMLASVDVKYVIIGHSERRIYQKETNDLLASKVKKVLAAGMSPILCCGENIEQRNTGEHKTAIYHQLKGGLVDLTLQEVQKLLVAYEPVWAIGTGQVASLEVITEMHDFIREILLEQYGMIGEKIPILYGGSCNAKNIAAILNGSNVNGGLIGGASLQVNHFMEMINNIT